MASKDKRYSMTGSFKDLSNPNCQFEVKKTYKIQISSNIAYVWYEMLSGVEDVMIYVSALCELFDKADTGGDGTISIPEYIVMCEEYGIEITEDHIESVRAIANENGEVGARTKIAKMKIMCR